MCYFVQLAQDLGVGLDDDRELVRGKVISGRGSHASWMTVHSELYQAKTGVRLYPGTLNVSLEREWHVPPPCIRLEPPEYGVPLSIVSCQIQGFDAFVIRTDKNDRGEGDHPPTVVEIAAGVRLRDELHLKDGDVVSVLLPHGADRTR